MLFKFLFLLFLNKKTKRSFTNVQFISTSTKSSGRSQTPAAYTESAFEPFLLIYHSIVRSSFRCGSLLYKSSDWNVFHTQNGNSSLSLARKGPESIERVNHPSPARFTVPFSTVSLWGLDITRSSLFVSPNSVVIV